MYTILDMSQKFLKSMPLIGVQFFLCNVWEFHGDFMISASPKVAAPLGCQMSDIRPKQLLDAQAVKTPPAENQKFVSDPTSYAVPLLTPPITGYMRPNSMLL